MEAATKALQMAEVEAADVDLIIMCSSTPDDIFGGGPRVSYRKKFRFVYTVYSLSMTFSDKFFEFLLGLCYFSFRMIWGAKKHAPLTLERHAVGLFWALLLRIDLSRVHI